MRGHIVGRLNVIVALVFLAAGSGFAATVRGRVVYEDEPIPGTTVTLAYASGRHQEAISNVKGEFELRDVPAGPAELTAELAGFSTVRHEVCIHAGENRWMITLDEPPESCDVFWSEPVTNWLIAGKVLDEGGCPLAGASAQAILSDGAIGDTQFTDGNGEVVLQANYGTKSIRIERKGYDTRTIRRPCYRRFTTELFPICTVSTAP